MSSNSRTNQITHWEPPCTAAAAPAADLDGDGYADLVTPVGERPSEAESDRAHTTVRTVPYITWGGAAATRARLTGRPPYPTGENPSGSP